MNKSSPILIAVTGAQGVGKSTFCERLKLRLAQGRSQEPLLINGLGDKIRSMGVPLGAASNPETIFAIFHEHLRREREIAATTEIVILDRCVIDALAYVRILDVTTQIQSDLFEELTKLASGRINLIFHLQLTDTFSVTSATHETPSIRAGIAELLPSILKELTVPYISLDASSDGAIDLAEGRVISLNGYPT